MSSQQKVTRTYTLLQLRARTLADIVQGLDFMAGVRLGACAFLIVGCRFSNLEENITFLKSEERKSNSPLFILN